MSPIDWDRPASGRGDTGCWIDGCGKKRGAFVAVTVRLPNEDSNGRTLSGYGRQLASRQHGFCKEHAEELFDALLPAVEAKNREQSR